LLKYGFQLNLRNELKCEKSQDDRDSSIDRVNQANLCRSARMPAWDLSKLSWLLLSQASQGTQKIFSNALIFNIFSGSYFF
jgi:hypothetical protein